MTGYVKLPLLFSFFGVLQVLVTKYLSYRDGLNEFWSWSLLTDIAFGFALYSILGFVLVAVHRAKVKRSTDNVSEQDFAVRQERKLVLNLSFAQTFAACKESLSVIDKHWLIEENQVEGRILIRTKPTLLEWWRDTVIFSLSKVGDTLTEVKIESRPTGRTPLIDNGKNLRRVEKLINFLQSKDKPIELSGVKEKLDDLFVGLRECERTSVK